MRHLSLMFSKMDLWLRNKGWDFYKNVVNGFMVEEKGDRERSRNNSLDVNMRKYWYIGGVG